METKWERLLDLYDQIEEDPAFRDLRYPGINLVRGDGAESVERARVMVVGEAPGARDTGAGKPFAGQRGQVLDGLLSLAGFHRRDAFVTTLVKYHGKGKRPSALYHQMRGEEWLALERAIVQPRLTICVGSAAHLMVSKVGYAMGLSQIRRGELWSFGSLENGAQAWTASQYSPSFGLKYPDKRPTMERDWDRLWEMCKSVGGILCGLCEGESAREGIPCAECDPEV